MGNLVDITILYFGKSWFIE